MQQFTRIKNVNFSGKYPLVLAPADIKDARIILIDVQMVRSATSPYFSDRTNPPNGFLGTFTQIWDDFVIADSSIDYEKTRFCIDLGCDPQLLRNQTCIHELDVQNLSLLGLALGQPNVVILDDYVKSIRSKPLPFSKFLFSCYADVALNVSVQVLKVEDCDLGGQPQPPPPSPSPRVPPPSIPVGTPVPPSLYAPREPGSGTDYAPAPLDDDGSPPLPPDCGAYNVEYSLFVPNVFDPPLVTTVQVPGFPYNTYLEPLPGSPGVRVAGILHFGLVNDVCVPDQKTPLVQTSEPIIVLQILNVSAA